MSRALCSIREIPESEYSEWDEFVHNAPLGSVYSTADYLEVLCSAAGGRFRILAADKGSGLLGGLALYEHYSRYGAVVAPRLLLYYNGLVLRADMSAALTLEVLSIIEAYLRNLPYARITLHSREGLDDLRPFLSHGWRVWPSYSYTVALGGGKVAAKGFNKDQRRLVRRAEELNLCFCEDDDFESFFALHTETHERKGAPIYLPRECFRRYVSGLCSRGLARLFHARNVAGEAVASQLVLISKHPVSHTVCAATRQTYLAQGAAPFLRARVFAALASAGSTANDLTDAALNAVSRFKSQLGAKLSMSFNLDLVPSRLLRLRLAVAQMFKGVKRG